MLRWPRFTVLRSLIEETFLTGNHLPSDGDDENGQDHSFASLTRQIQNQFHLFDKTKNETTSDKKNLFAYLNCKHASIWIYLFVFPSLSFSLSLQYLCQILSICCTGTWIACIRTKEKDISLITNKHEIDFIFIGKRQSLSASIFITRTSDSEPTCFHRVLVEVGSTMTFD